MVSFDWTFAVKEAFVAQIWWGRDMDDDHRELVRGLFAAATELIETAHEASVAGQSTEIAAEDYIAAAHRVTAKARDVATLAEAAMIVANLSVNQCRENPEQRR